MLRSEANQIITEALTPNPKIEAADVQLAINTTLNYTDSSFGIVCPYVGDGKNIIDGVMSAGSAILTSATAAFQAGDVGKWIEVRNVNSTGNGLVTTTIASVQSPTQATLAVAASKATTGTGTRFMFGTPMDNLIQPWIMSEWAKGKDLRVLFKNGLYLFTGDPNRVSVTGQTFIAHLYVPFTPYKTSSSIGYQTLSFEGENLANTEQQGIVLVGTPYNGVTFYSNYFAGFPAAAIIGVEAPGGGGIFDVWNYTNFQITNIATVCETESGISTGTSNLMGGVNLGKLTQAHVGRLKTSVSFNIMGSREPLGSVGLQMPEGNNHALNTLQFLYTSGFRFGITATEHFNGQFIIAVGCYVGVQFSGTYGNALLFYTAECCRVHIGIGDNTAVHIGTFEREKQLQGLWYDNLYDLTGGSIKSAIHIGQKQGASKFTFDNPGTRIEIAGDQIGETIHLASNWTTATRPTVPIKYQNGFNETLNKLELWNGTAWV